MAASRLFQIRSADICPPETHFGWTKPQKDNIYYDDKLTDVHWDWQRRLCYPRRIRVFLWPKITRFEVLA
jgi:hypothetical protein